MPFQSAGSIWFYQISYPLSKQIYHDIKESWKSVHIYCSNRNCQKLTESQQFLIFYAKTEDVGKYEYSWYRNCQKLTESQQFLIFYAKAEDVGKYECEISKNEKPKRSQKSVEVLVKCE